MKKIVVIGGGTGLSSMLKGMKRLEDVDLTAIVTVADDGVVRDEFVIYTIFLQLEIFDMFYVLWPMKKMKAFSLIC